jgi:hypothetical protein
MIVRRRAGDTKAEATFLTVLDTTLLPGTVALLNSLRLTMAIALKAWN